MVPPKNAQVIDFPTSTIWFDESGIMYSVAKPNAPQAQTLEEMKKLLDDFKKVLGGKKVCMLVESVNSTPPSKAIRDYLAEEFPKFTKAIAMLSYSPLSRMVANLFFTVKKQPYPTKFFENEKAAKECLKQYL